MDAVREEDLTEVERKVIRIKDLMSVAGLNPEVNMDGADGRAQGAASMKVTPRNRAATAPSPCPCSPFDDKGKARKNLILSDLIFIFNLLPPFNCGR